MKILYIYRDPNLGFSIDRAFRPIEHAMKQYAEVDSICMSGNGYSLKALWNNILLARKAVTKKDYDIIHITGQEHYLTPFLPLDKLVVTVHDLGFIQQEHGFSGVMKHLLFVKSLSLAHQLTCISEKTRKEIDKYCNIPGDRIHVIGNCVNPDIEFRPRRINEFRPRILHIGTMKHKNLIRTVHALANMPCHLRIIGILDSEQQQELKSSSIEYSVVSNLSDQQMHQELYDCDIVNFPSLYEGFGMPIVEAQSAGRVVITSNLSPMKEIAGTGAVLVDPNSVESLKAGYAAAIRDFETIVERGRINVLQRFDVTSIATQYYNVYLKLLGKSAI